jgi:hypothetical protein
MNHYGFENFEIFEIEDCGDDHILAKNREVFWISYYKSNDKQFGYNMTLGGDGGNTNGGKKLKRSWFDGSIEKYGFDEAIKRKREKYKIISEKLKVSHKGIKHNKETKEKISETLKKKYDNGEIKTNPWNKGLSGEGMSFYGKTHSEKARKKISQSRSGKTYKEIYGDNASIQIEKKRSNWLGNKNPNYKKLDLEIIKQHIKNVSTIKELALLLKVSPPTLVNKLKFDFNTTFKELKNDNLSN